MKKKLKIVISCGPTREPLDPVRFISNYSTGTLGLTLARLARRRGHEVVLVHGPIEVPKDLKVRKVSFETVLELMKALRREVPRCDVLYMVAAVSDFKPLVASEFKIKKGGRFLNLSLVQNPDVLKSMRRFKKDKIYVGFSLESKHLFKHSYKKLKDKDLDLIVAQHVDERTRPFGAVRIGATIIESSGRRVGFDGISKEALSRYLIRRVDALRVARRKRAV